MSESDPIGELVEKLRQAARDLDDAWLGDAELSLDCALPAYLREAASVLLSLGGLGKGNISSVAESAASRFALTASETPCQSDVQPIDMILFCPACGVQHIDEVRNGVWENPPHRSHLCYGCGHIWRHADVPTNGVAAIKTVGKADSPPVSRSSEAQPVSPSDEGASAGTLPPDEPLSSTPDEYEGGDRLALALAKAADALAACAVNHDCPRAREAAREADLALALPQHRTSSDGEGRTLAQQLHAMGYQRVFNAISDAVSIWPESARAKAKAQGYGISISVEAFIRSLVGDPPPPVLNLPTDEEA
jgi:hypothetical protein